MATKTKKTATAEDVATSDPRAPKLSDELMAKFLNAIALAGPGGMNRNICDRQLAKLSNEETTGIKEGIDEARTWQYLEEMMRRGLIHEANAGGQQPWYTALDQTPFKQAVFEEQGGEDAMERKAARRQARSAASTETRSAAPKAKATKTPSPAKSPRSAAPTKASETGAWTVLRKKNGTDEELVIGKFDDKKDARVTARKSRLSGFTVLILDLHDQVTNTYED